MTTIAHAAAPAEPEPLIVTIGVDTHRDVHVASARDQLGRRIGVTLIPTTPAGYQQLLDWARWLGEIAAFGTRGDRLLRCRAGPLPARRRLPSDRGQPARPGRPPAPRQVRPRRC